MHPTDQTSMAVVLEIASIMTSHTFKEYTNIVSKAEHDLRCAIPASGHVFCHESLIASSFGSSSTWSVAPGQAKIADLEFTISVDEQISGLQISVKNISGMNILQATEGLINEGLEMGIGEWLTRSNLHYPMSTNPLDDPRKHLRSHGDLPPSAPPTDDIRIRLYRAGWAYIEINFIEIAVRLEHYVHVIQTSDLEVTVSIDRRTIEENIRSCDPGSGVVV
jgi:hypothetical protein